MSDRSRKEPMSKRLFNTRAHGGPLPRHLAFLVRILYKRQGKDAPAANDLNYKDQNALAYHLKHHFSDQEIDLAHEMAIEMYKGGNREQIIQASADKAGAGLDIKENDITPEKSPEEMSTDDLYRALELNKKYNEAREKNDSEKDKKKPEHQDGDERYVLVDPTFTDHVEDEAKAFINLEEKITQVDRAGKASRDMMSRDLVALKARVEEISIQKPLRLEIIHPKVGIKNTGVVHKAFPDLVTATNARLDDGTRLNVWMYGPAGTGKTAAAKQLGKLLFEDEKYYESNAKSRAELKAQFDRDWSSHNYSPTLSTGFEVMGYNDANGRYVPTPFYLAYKYGGTFLLDEIDGSMQDALLKLNGALSSTFASFPCGIVERHPDCVILAAANTTGYGGDIEYLGTMKQNVAFLDRWSFLEWPHDDALENALILNKPWLDRVRQVRANMADRKIKGYVVTMRASLQGEALLAAGMPWEKVEQMVLRKGLPQGTWNMIKDKKGY